jgi:Ohr subfamily peroxiredoxin
MKTIYTIKATSVGGRNGHVRSDFDLIDADVRLPKSLGGADDQHLTPETFFAAGYAACFDNAVMHVMRNEKVTAGTPTTQAVVGLDLDDTGGLSLAVELIVEIPGISQENALELVEKAHKICPYSKATRGNVNVKLTVK